MAFSKGRSRWGASNLKSDLVHWSLQLLLEAQVTQFTNAKIADGAIM
jgi:hypothetical protein